MLNPFFLKIILLADKYCPLLKEEGGIELLRQLLNDSHPKPPVKELAEEVIEFVEKRDKALLEANIDCDIEAGNNMQE